MALLAITGNSSKGMAEPLTAMLRKDSFSWTQNAAEAFDQLKQVLTTSCSLSLPDFTLSFQIECDASSKGVGAVLMQQQRPIAYYSKALHGKE